MEPVATIDTTGPSPDGTVYSARKRHCPFSTPSLESYAAVVGEERIERLVRTAQPMKGLKLLDINATAQGGGVAEMLYSSVPFMNELGIEAEWKIIRGNKDYFEITKRLHNLMQGMKGTITPEMKETYRRTLDECASLDLRDNGADVVQVHDPQPLGLTQCLKKQNEIWLWRCHIDCEAENLEANPDLWEFITDWAEHYEAAIFSAAHYVVSRWTLLKFIIPPFIDPLSEKNRELSQEEVDKVLARHQIDSRIPIIAQIGRFDPWKGLGRTIATYREVRKQTKCQLILAGGFATDDPEGERVLAQICSETKEDEDIHILNLSLEDRLRNWAEVNALQRASNVIMQPSIREGFGLVITEALWKGKPVIAADAGAMPLQIRDGDTGYFYESPTETADLVTHLLQNPAEAAIVGNRGKAYVQEHFLLPDRLADFLMAVDMVMNSASRKDCWKNCVMSFHPWFNLPKNHHEADKSSVAQVSSPNTLAQ